MSSLITKCQKGDEKAFLRRAVEMNENAMQKDTVQKEDAIRRVILNISL